MAWEHQPSLHSKLTAGGCRSLITDSGGHETLNMERGRRQEGDGHFGSCRIGDTSAGVTLRLLQPSAGLVTALRYERNESSRGCAIRLSLKHQRWGGFFGTHSCRHPSSTRTGPAGDSTREVGAAWSRSRGLLPPQHRADNADKDGTQGALVLVPAQIPIRRGL